MSVWSPQERRPAYMRPRCVRCTCTRKALRGLTYCRWHAFVVTVQTFRRGVAAGETAALAAEHARLAAMGR